MPATLLGAPTTRSHTPDALERGIGKFFGENLPTYDNGMLEVIFTVEGSEKQTESSVVSADLGQAIVKAEGATPATDSLQEVYKRQTSHSTFCLMVEFTEECIEDQLYRAIVPRAGTALARSMGYTRQVQGFGFFNDLTETIYAMGGTNYQLLEYAAAGGHPILSGGGWNNRPEFATTLSQSALEERLQVWGIDMLDHRGFKVDSKPRYLMHGYSDEMLVHRLLKSNLRPQSADNDLNPIKDLRDLEPFCNPHLTDDRRWFLIGPKNTTALRFFDRVKAGTNKYGEPNTGNVRIRARARYSKECPSPIGIMGSPGT